MRLRALAYVLPLLAALALGACGSDSESATSDPAKKPALIAPPSADTLASTNQQSTTSTASSDSETTTTAPATTTPSTGTGTGTGGTGTGTGGAGTGGTATPQTTTPATGGSGGQAAPQANSGNNQAQNFETFCKQNPGAC